MAILLDISLLIVSPLPTMWMIILTQKLLPWQLYSLEQLEGAINEERIHSRAFLHEQVFDLEEKKQPVTGAEPEGMRGGRGRDSREGAE